MTVAFSRGCDDQSAISNPDYTSYQQFRLEIVSGPDTGKVLVSNGRRTIIGRGPGADLVLQDQEVAPYQLEIVASAKRIDIIDLAEQSTTRVNDLEISVAHLGRAATIQIGDTEIRFEPLSARLHVRRSMETSFADLVGSSLAMRELFADLERLAPIDVPVLIRGEAGSGKQAVARALHRQSPRAAGKFYVVDCAASRDEVERGLVTAFEQAGGGILYLEQVGAMPHDLQSRLLRVFKNGGPGAIADLRIVSSSSSDLRRAVNRAAFDAELLQHLSPEVVSVPSMRRRFADLERLVEKLLRGLGANEAFALTLRGSDYLQRLQRYGWPGNVLELRSHLERCLRTETLLPVGDAAANLNHTAGSEPPAATPDVDIARPIKAGREEWVKHFERMYLAQILDSQGGNVTRAAKAAGVDRGHFYRLMMRCGLRS